MKRNTEFLIIGQGIAGTLLAHALEERGQSVVVIDADHRSSSSRVAAGLFHPMQFRRMRKAWKTDTVLPPAHETYANLSKMLARELIRPMPVLRQFQSTSEFNLWEERVGDDGYAEVMEPKVIQASERPGVELPHHGGRVLGGGWVPVAALLEAYREYLTQSDKLIRGDVQQEDIQVGADQVSVQTPSGEIKAKHLIFCTGWQVHTLPWFSWVPLQPVKGELLTVRIKGLTTEEVLNAGMFLLPQGNDVYWLGATWDWKAIDEEPTAVRRDELLEKLKRIVRKPVEVIGHRAGLRPTVKDRRPMVGHHPELERLVLLNGMGARGIMYAPYCAGQLADHLVKGSEIDPEIDLARFYPHFQPSEGAS